MRNTIIETEHYLEIKLKYNGCIYYTKIDKEDLDKIEKYTWHLHCRKKDMRLDVCTNRFSGYKNRGYTNIARYLMDCPQNKAIDHINHDTLDNRKENLRICTVFENNQNKTNNTSGCVGVTFDKARNKWKVYIGKDGVLKNIGRFDNFEDARQARVNAENSMC